MSVAIVVPIYREILTDDEKLSLDLLNELLYRYPKVAVVPTGLHFHDSRFTRIELEEHHFRNREAYSHLLLSRSFYQAFEQYEFILIYQLDCLLFRDELQSWCDKGYDYIGPPLFNNKYDAKSGLSRVGNGGFSLRRVRAFLDVLNAPIPPWSRIFINGQSTIESILKKAKVVNSMRNGVEWYTGHYTLNEDLFWTDRARYFKPDFNIAPIEEALQFAFEAHPRWCFERNGRNLPFGAHAWNLWDRAFWEERLFEKDRVPQ